MLDRKEKEFQPINNIENTIIEPAKSHKQTLGKTIIEIFTGVSSSAMAVGSKVTAGAVVYSGESTKDQETATTLFSIGSLIFNVLNFLQIPAGYLYKLYKNETVPFNQENNYKWAQATLMLALSIISAAVKSTALIISYFSAGINAAISVEEFFKYFYSIKEKEKEIDDIRMRIMEKKNNIKIDMLIINHAQDDIRSLYDPQHPNMRVIQPLIIELSKSYHLWYQHCDELQTLTHEKFHLKRDLHYQKSKTAFTFNMSNVLFTFAIIAGTVLLAVNPVTVTIGTYLIAMTAITSLLTLVAQKIIQVIQQRNEYRYEKSQRKMIEIKQDTTCELIKRMHSKPSAAHLSDLVQSSLKDSAAALAMHSAKPENESNSNDKNQDNEQVSRPSRN